MTTIAAVRAATAQRFQISEADLVSRVRKVAIVRPRQMAMLIAREETRASLPMIARAFGVADHSTVIHAIKVARARVWRSLVWDAHYQAIKEALS